MRRTSFADVDCSVAQCLEVVGDWWTLAIVRDIFLGTRRFEPLQQGLGISRNVLQQRLERLVDDGVLYRSRYQAHPPRHEYRLTEKGLDLWHVLIAMRQWGDRWAAPDGPPMTLHHRSGCGEQMTVVPCCSACGEALGPRDVESRAGPGRTAND